MRLKSEIWVQAYLRICAVQGLFGVLAKRGDADAGAIFIRVWRLDGRSDVYGPAAAGLATVDADRQFSPRFPGAPASVSGPSDNRRDCRRCGSRGGKER